MKDSTAARLKRLLNERSLKQVDVLSLAAPYVQKYNVKLTKSDLSQYISGKAIPRQDKLTILGLALNVSEAWLMGYDVPMERTQMNCTAQSRSLLDISLTEREVSLIQKYRSLDRRGQEAVDNVLDHEYRAAVAAEDNLLSKQA